MMLNQFLAGYGALTGYFALCAAAALLLRRLIAVPQELFRKTLHFILLGSIFVLMEAFRVWWISALASLTFIAMVFPLLALAEHIPGYSALLTERKDGEIKRSLVVVFGMFAVVISCAGAGLAKNIWCSRLCSPGDWATRRRHWWGSGSAGTASGAGWSKGARASRERSRCLGYRF